MLARAANPFTRTALLAFAWTHRHAILRWGRSLSTELRRPGRIEPRRLQQIGRVLWAITRDDSLSGAKQLREVRLDGDVLVIDAQPGWKREARLVDALSGIPGIAGITDPAGRSLLGTIDVSSR
ncbi:MAG TPA: hypothetical protein VMM60_00020 [Ilumatobacter sp.]|nr:hypothetical protein [Ilumatobacter sp.]